MSRVSDDRGVCLDVAGLQSVSELVGKLVKWHSGSLNKPCEQALKFQHAQRARALASFL